MLMTTTAELEEADRAHSRFWASLVRQGVDLTRVELRGSQGGLSWGAHAKYDLPAGSSVANIPLSLALTEDVVLGSAVAADAKELGLAVDTRTLFYMFMLQQRADESLAARWGPYLRAIPTRHTDPMG